PAGGTPFERYRGAAMKVDSYLGTILDAVDRPPLAGRALLLFMSDHGEAFGEHDTREHSKTLYEELLRVPLAAYGAGVQPRVVTDPVTLADLGPTLLDLFGRPTPAGFEGQSLVACLRGGGAAATRPILAEGRLRRAIVAGDLKLIVDLRRKIVESYDLARDPGEQDNLADGDDRRFAPLLSALD